MITLAIQCQHFERRLCWMLSSMAEQTSRRFIVDIAYRFDSGVPKTQDVIEFFRGRGVSIIKRCYMTPERFEQRGYTRNDQLAACSTPWIWFADCDHVYHPDYVEKLLVELKKHEDESKLITAGRISTYWGRDPFPFPDDKPAYHKDAFKIVSKVFDTHRGSACGAGFMQIAKVDNLPDRVYVPEGKSNDHKWSEQGTQARSDGQFRKKVGGKIRLPGWFTLNQIHLNHRRDSKEGKGKHLTEQR